jgi:hypothetical protein
MKRRGLVTACVLVCLIITVSLVATLLQSTLRARRDVAVRLQVLQTDWLLDAGIQLANRQLAKSVDYEGETWQIDDTLPGYFAGHAIITVQREDDNAIVEVVARLCNSSNSKTIVSNLDRAGGLVTQRSHQWQIKNFFPQENES